MRTRRGNGLLLLLSILLLAGICLWQNASRLPKAVSGHFDPATSHYILADDVRLDVNRATVEELTELPGIGEVLAQRIVEYREQNGSYARIEDLLLVSGVGEQTLSNIREYIGIRTN